MSVLGKEAGEEDDRPLLLVPFAFFVDFDDSVEADNDTVFLGPSFDSDEDDDDDEDAGDVVIICEGFFGSSLNDTSCDGWEADTF